MMLKGKDICYISDHAERLRKLYSVLSQTIDAQSVAAAMFADNALTLAELESIQSKRKQPARAAQLLLGVVIAQSSEVYGSFLKALNSSGDEGKTLYRLVLENNCRGKQVVGNNSIISLSSAIFTACRIRIIVALHQPVPL